MMRVADLAERLTRLEPLTDRLGMGSADDLTVTGGHEGELADLLVDLLNDRLELLSALEVLTRHRPVLKLRALVVPVVLVEVDGLIALLLHELFLFVVIDQFGDDG